VVAGRAHADHKQELRAHFARGLELAPDITFTEEVCLSGMNGYSLLYRRENGNRRRRQRSGDDRKPGGAALVGSVRLPAEGDDRGGSADCPDGEDDEVVAGQVRTGRPVRETAGGGADQGLGGEVAGEGAQPAAVR
jgi:hypothetical protein